MLTDNAGNHTAGVLFIQASGKSLRPNRVKAIALTPLKRQCLDSSKMFWKDDKSYFHMIPITQNMNFIYVLHKQLAKKKHS